MTPTKEIVYTATFVALLIAAQFALSALPNIEIVTALLAVWSFVMGARRALLATTSFSAFRCIVFGFYPTVILLYLVYYGFLAIVVSLLGRIKAINTSDARCLVVVTVTVTALSPLFTLADCVITPLFYGFTHEAAVAYFFASLPFMGLSAASAAIGTSVLLLPVKKVLCAVKREKRSLR